MQPMHLSLQIRPNVPSDELYAVVDAVIADIKATGLPHIVGPMETTIEGELDQLLAIVKQAHLRCIELGATRVGATINTDLKIGGLTFDEKLHQYR
ncbi:MAG: thiamine-binding protein [Gammaproteobacteria bacterium]|nr:thiamine-binding protein [Gammaproteobacteria bacterium]